MQFDVQLIEKAIGYHAVVLNRPAWLDPDRLAIQVEVWQKLIVLDSGQTPGKLVLDDFVLAMTSGLELHEVMPALFIHGAVGTAKRRAEKAAELMACTPELLMVEDVNRFRQAVLGRSANDPGAFRRAADKLQLAALEAQFCLLNSGLDDDVSGVVARVQQNVEDAIQAWVQAPVLPEHTEQDDADVKAVIGEMFRNAE